LLVGRGVQSARAHPVNERIHELVIHPADQLAMVLGKRIERTVRKAKLIGALLARLKPVPRERPLR
jgi:hypothetical protein